MNIIDDMEDAFRFIEAGVEHIATRVAQLGDGGTAGPDASEHPIVDDVAPLGAGEFVGGWWSEAMRFDAHPGRIGPPIDPCVVVDHETDMHPDDWGGLKKSWSERPGDGACAQFLVGRDAVQGILQWMSIARNGNHAGGATHGVYVDASGRRYHPNVLSVGIEFHCAGGQLRLIGGVWRYVENGVMHGAPIPSADVEPDPQRPGRGWHRLSAYQLAVRARLHAALDKTMRPMPSGLRAVSTGETVPAWGVARSTRFVGHVTLDPTSRSDPWPNGMRDIAAPQPTRVPGPGVSSSR